MSIQHLSREIKTPMSHFCEERLVFWGQYGPTCWFNAILVSAFYSQRLRRKMFKAAKSWPLDSDKRNEIFGLLHHVLYHKYIKSTDYAQDILFFNAKRPEYILQLMHAYDKKKFMLKNFSRGFQPHWYIKQFYELLNISSILLTKYADGSITPTEKKNETKITYFYTF